MVRVLIILHDRIIIKEPTHMKNDSQFLLLLRYGHKFVHVACIWAYSGFTDILEKSKS